MKKRYQYWSKDGIKWSNWFIPFNGTECPEWQLKNKLRNELIK